MPIPFIFMAIAGATAAVGAGKNNKGGSDTKDAKDTNDAAEYVAKKAAELANKSRKNSGDAITELGKTKLAVLEESVKPFIASFEKIHNVELSESIGMDELQKFRIDKQSLDELKEIQTIGGSILGGVAGGAALGAIAAFGAYGGAMTFGAASTRHCYSRFERNCCSKRYIGFSGRWITCRREDSVSPVEQRYWADLLLVRRSL